MAAGSRDKHNGPHEPHRDDAGRDHSPLKQEAGKIGDGASSPNEGERPAVDEEIAQLRAAIKDLEAKLLRSLADQENSRKRSQREAEAAVKFAASAFVADLLPTLDNLQFALDAGAEGEAASEPMKQIMQGLRASERALLSAMQKHGIERIAPLGEPFDPNRHAAVAAVERSDAPSGTVAEVLQPGYLHYDRLLRPAMVNVATGGSANTPVENPAPANGANKASSK